MDEAKRLSIMFLLFLLIAIISFLSITVDDCQQKTFTVARQYRKYHYFLYAIIVSY